MQEAAVMACEQLGFSFGFFNKADGAIIDISMARPPWLGRAVCGTDAESFEDCVRVLGDTSVCGVPMALFCSTDAARTLICCPYWFFTVMLAKLLTTSVLS